MLKRILAVLTSAFLLCAPFAAQAKSASYEGKVVATVQQQITSPAGGTIKSIDIALGELAKQDGTLAQISAKKVFATQDGKVAHLSCAEGEPVSGSVLQVAPLSRYTIHCTVDKAYQSTASTLVHTGETAYIKCTADGTHRAVGTITQIDENEYRVLTTGGDLYVGETVYIYRDSDYTTKQKIGIGTVVNTDPEDYTAEGCLSKLYVAQGDTVERGQLLYEFIQSTSGASIDGNVTSSTGGIVTQVNCEEGDSVEENAILFTVSPRQSLRLQIDVDEEDAAQLTAGSSATLTLNNAEETTLNGTIESISAIEGSDGYCITILPDDVTCLKIGMTATVTLK